MGLEDLVAALALAAVVAYGVLAGADFGGGVWDLAAGGPRHDAQRKAVAHAMGPVWEANHVWLIFAIVLLFAGYPTAFAALCVGLFVPFHLVLVGITLRGAAFVFRAYGPRTEGVSRSWGWIFGAASAVTPFLLGQCLGAVSAGWGMTPGATTAAPWCGPFALTLGALALAVCAYLAAVYLTVETAGALREDFRARALAAGTAVVALTAVALPLTRVYARHLWDGLVSPIAAPVLAIGVVAALASGWALRTRRYHLARYATVVQVAFVLGGWGMAQYPYLIAPDVTLVDAAAPAPTLRFLLITAPMGAALLVPSLWLLFRVFKSGRETNGGDPS